jgi:hypothetical protein
MTVLGNPWWSIYEDFKNNPIPTATAVPVMDEESHQQAPSNGGVEDGSFTRTKVDAGSAVQHPHFCLVCSPVDVLSGILVGSLALMGVILCEVFALAFFYLPAALAYCTAQAFSPPNVCTGVPYSFFMIFYFAFALCDSVLLFTSVLLTELVACVGYVTSLLTGGVLMARYWHQQIRRSCHGVRVMFRKLCPCKPSRTFVLWSTIRGASEGPDQHVMGAETVPIPVHHASNGMDQHPLGTVPIPIAVQHTSIPHFSDMSADAKA